MIKNFNINKNSTQSGRSMIEMLGVLAIVGVLSVGGIAGYSKAMTKFKINKIIDQVTHIATNTRTLYAQQTTYDGLKVTNAVQMGIIPTDLGTEISTNEYVSKLKNPFNGSVYVSGHWQDKSFVITYQGIPKEACIALATYDWGSNYSSGLVALSISNYGGDISGPINTMTDTVGCEDREDYRYVACPGDANNPTPISVATAAQKCDCEDSSCSIGWKFQ